MEHIQYYAGWAIIVIGWGTLITCWIRSLGPKMRVSRRLRRIGVMTSLLKRLY